uniref:NADH dehydrogenase subunit 1 n=1 Tax=Nototeredo knoxi TaxID=2939324 RepID=UPI00202967E6|nr:NADH dehydrogenase subunit 1 [Nototeredo knoxi]UPX89277.1 NADH dehydrogenase subunit 1 [Nototeredo knoxi]
MLSSILVVLIMQIGVSFFILTERKGLGMFQLRQGPNKASFKALGQPVADGVKLFIKQLSYPFSASLFSYLLGPAVLFFLSCLAWLVFPMSQGSFRFEWGFLYFLCVSSLHVFGVFICGYSCNSRYGLLGAMRGVAQSISYEIVMSSIVFCPLLLVGSYDLVECREWGMINSILIIESFVVWLIVMLAETNRTPFDFVEGESELVAGYSVEYGGGAFAMIALAEYGNIFFVSVITSVLFLSGVGLFPLFDFWYDFWLGLSSVLFCYFFIIIRGALPRFRYDLLMRLCWLTLLPITLAFVSLYVFVL